jgi:hypothetical protein
MAAVTCQLERASLVDPLTIGVALVFLVLLVRFKINSTWLIAVEALVGWLSTLLPRSQKVFFTLSESDLEFSLPADTNIQKG